MIDIILEPISQVPWSYLVLVLSVSLFFIYGHSRMSGLGVRQEMAVLLKGIVFVFALALVSLSTTIVLKYASYLKIDIMHLSSFEFFVVSALICAYVAEKTLISDGKGGIAARYIGRIPYLFRQAGLYIIMVAIAYYFNQDASLLHILVAVMPVNVLYHLSYLGFGGWVFRYFLKLSDRADSFIDGLGGLGNGHKIKEAAGR